MHVIGSETRIGHSTHIAAASSELGIKVTMDRRHTMGFAYYLACFISGAILAFLLKHNMSGLYGLILAIMGIVLISLTYSRRHLEIQSKSM